ncbi:MAG: metallophosphoesterase family protein [Thermoanaerobaculia bacterium]
MANRIPEDRRAKLDRARSTPHDKLTAHRGMATWGERLVPLAEFRRAAEREGRSLSPVRRVQATETFTARRQDPTPVEGPYSRVVVFGGIYNNHFALEALLEAAERDRTEAVYCLGDLGGFGPHPDKIWPLLDSVRTIQGNYEESLASAREDCNCGYTDPRDNHFAEVSYSYTARNTSDDFKRWMGDLPRRRRVRLGELEMLLVHGSPRRINEFLFASTTPDAFIEVLLDQEGADGLLCTHTGLHWHRKLASGRDAVNVGVIGRPANDGRRSVWYTLLEARGPELVVEHRPLDYDHQGLAREMRDEGLPEEFIETILSGWWTTCLEILPAKERTLSRF